MITPDLVFMLTRDDRTVPDARERLTEALAAGVRYIGFKNVGLPPWRLRDLATAIREAGGTTYLEMVDLDPASEERSAASALEWGVDVLMGGTRPHLVCPIIGRTSVRYYPFVGQVVGHPSRLVGSPDELVDGARRLSSMPEIDGIDLLAYRFAGDVDDLMRRICEAAAPKPVVVAGSIDREERLAAAVAAGRHR